MKFYLSYSREFVKRSLWYIINYKNAPPLNGQEKRKNLFDLIFEKINFSSIIESGTFLGTTSSYLSKRYDKNVYTCEINLLFFMYACTRYYFSRKINLFYSDSRKLIKRLIKKGINSRITFFYLDAHWYDDQPLNEELNIILNNWEEAIICIDDFKVDIDSGYKYDKYNSTELSLKYLNKINNINNLDFYFPLAPSESETGKKRGSIFIAKGIHCRNKLRECDQLFIIGEPFIS